MELPVVPQEGEIHLVAGVDPAGGAASPVEHQPRLAATRPVRDDLDHDPTTREPIGEDVLVQAPREPGHVELLVGRVAEGPAGGPVAQRPDKWLELHGPVPMVFRAVGPPGEGALASDLLDLVGRFDRSGDETMVVASEYLWTVIVRR